MAGPAAPTKDMISFFGAQVVAAILAAFAYTGLFFEDFNLTPSSGFGWWDACVCEVIYTFMLCFVVLNVAAAKKNTPNGVSWVWLGVRFRKVL